MLASVPRVGFVAALSLALLAPGCRPAAPPAPLAVEDEASAADPGPPEVPDNFVLQPTIHAEAKTYSAGTAFSVTHPDLPRPVVVTCLHIFGTAGGYAKDIPPLDLPRVVKSLELADRFTDADVGEVSGGMIPIPDSAPLGEPGAAGDIAAAWAPEGAPLAPGKLAAKAPRAGQPVWLAGRLIGAKASDPKLRRAVVAGVNEGLLEYRFDDAGLQLRATSGAPVLNAKGEVVAIHLGGGKDGGQLVGVGNPAAAFTPHLLAACKANPPAKK